MESTIEQFLKLSSKQKKKIHFDLCSKALITWNEYIMKIGDIKYIDSVCGSQQIIDSKLPTDAYNCAIKEIKSIKIMKRYLEPITALNDEDIKFPENITYGYYSIYNLFLKYSKDENIDDWMIVNQALSIDKSKSLKFFKNMIQNA